MAISSLFRQRHAHQTDGTLQHNVRGLPIRKGDAETIEGFRGHGQAFPSVHSWNGVFRYRLAYKGWLRLSTCSEDNWGHFTSLLTSLNTAVIV